MPKTNSHTTLDAYHCQSCNRPIGRSGRHSVFAGGLILCARCVSDWKGDSRTPHGRYYPDCPHAERHDMWDHFDAGGDRLGTWYILKRQSAAT